MAAPAGFTAQIDVTALCRKTAVHPNIRSADSTPFRTVATAKPGICTRRTDAL
ncbi:hypothetical protein POSPLADRAFT_1039856 [Postia placenta MAD-698-R-SB12]|uniref:Uncharacterized protein n=1 Tax=Postia placenta MAD-698-R-SB12 TaxID=670580 RepID=A0A1X6N3E2_9APHY|nr:hypothetical protein POSPLADRAFT_1039856 [Postia placenta MAD-698-R-SB12]OSX63124.1 hypothetical protein POSPLADRAFT_1039856 [Postia placenta MAD-698-R-SB12]